MLVVQAVLYYYWTGINREAVSEVFFFRESYE